MSEPQYKMVDGELVALTPEEIAAIEEEQPPQPLFPDASAEGERANARLDAGIDAAEETVVKLKALPVPPTKSGEVTREEFDALRARVDAIQQAVTAMLDAQAAPV